MNFASHRHSALMVAIIAAFAVRAVIGESRDATLAFGAAFMMLLLVAVYNVNRDDLLSERGILTARVRRRRIIAWSLAAVAGVERICLTFIHNHSLELMGTLAWLLFVLFVTVTELQSVLRQKEVTGETICMAVSVYLLAGFTWALVYIVIFERHPASFAGLGAVKPGDASSLQHIFPLFGYYSLGTLSTIGGSDITPVGLQARYATVAEAIMGQFYMAILVGRLVGLQMSHSMSSKAD